MEETRERTALVILKNHFNSVNKYPLEEKIRVAQMIIEDGLKVCKIEDKKQLKLSFEQ